MTRIVKTQVEVALDTFTILVSFDGTTSSATTYRSFPKNLNIMEKLVFLHYSFQKVKLS